MSREYGPVAISILDPTPEVKTSRERVPSTGFAGRLLTRKPIVLDKDSDGGIKEKKLQKSREKGKEQGTSETVDGEEIQSEKDPEEGRKKLCLAESTERSSQSLPSLDAKPERKEGRKKNE